MPPSGGTRTSLSVQARFVSQGFGSGGPFSAGTPLVPPDPQPTRVFDFAVGSNLTYTPRATEALGFPALRSFANVEIVRLAIETRKNQMKRLRWRVRSRDERKPEPGADARIKAATALLQKPDGKKPFRQWFRLLLEDLLVLDAPAVERRWTVGGQLVGLDVVPGDTIKPLVDDTGRTPAYPDPCYQQVIKGRIWSNLTERDLIYVPANPRSNHLYGFGPVEQVIVTAFTAMQRQSRQLAWFTDGNAPPGMINAPEGWTPDQIKQYQEWFDAKLRGRTDERSSLIWGPANAKYSPFKDPPLKDDFDEWLARIVCYAFDLAPTPFIRQMNRSTADSDADRALEEGREPLMLWGKDLFDGVIQDDLGFADLEFDWDVPRDIDPKVQAEIEDRALRNGSRTIDEVRDARGEDPLPEGLGAKPLIYTAKGAMLLEHVVNSPSPEELAAQMAAAKAGAETPPADDDETDDEE
jgi:hypothetical protein